MKYIRRSKNNNNSRHFLSHIRLHRIPAITRIVGIGASAGGVQALVCFLKHTKPDSGISYVIIEHLDPASKNTLAPLLQKATSMTVVQASNSMRVQPNYVYVIPPDKSMAIHHGVLQLQEPEERRGLRLPIDFFFHALAQDQRELAIGVILSGMGADGTVGAREIKKMGGLVVVQKPTTAQFDSMPRSIIDAGLADIVLPVEELPGAILQSFMHFHAIDNLYPMTEMDAQDALKLIITLLRQRCGNDFSLYKKNTVLRRIERRIGLHKLESIIAYVNYVKNNPQELDLLFKELLIGVTNFFRDPEVWIFLKEQAIPALLAQYPEGKVLRAWVPACSTGEEAFSLAIVFREVLEQVKPTGQFSLQIFATDLDLDAIDLARQGIYRINNVSEVAPDRLARFFIQDNNSYRVCKEIRDMVIFAQQNVITDPPFTKLDMLTCRNLLIYFNQELQHRLLPLFHYALNPHGILLLGSAETIGSFHYLFAPVDTKARVFQRRDIPSKLSSVVFPTKYSNVMTINSNDTKSSNKESNLQYYADQYLLQHFSPAAVLVNNEGDILYINGRTGIYLEPAAGKANWNIYAMAREGLRYELASAMRKITRQGEKQVVLEGLQLADSNQKGLSIKITLQAIDRPEALHGMIFIVFANAAESNADRISVGELQPEPSRAQTELQAVREEMQVSQEELTTANEELQSTNEELQSINEELQSSNEELTTSKEELQSMNEELQSVNAELESKLDDLSRINNDMNNLLNSTDIATVFLDSSLNVRRFTLQATNIFKLINSDIGRPLSDIVTTLQYDDLKKDEEEVLRTLVFKDNQVASNDGRWFRVRIVPYRTSDNFIDGLVLTFFDITEAKSLEMELRKTQKPSH